MLKKILILVLVLCISMSNAAQALEIETIGPETSFIESLERDIEDDSDYLKNIALLYKDKYVVTQEEYVDISSIDKFYASLSMPLTLSEIDEGKVAFSTDKVFNDNLKREFNLFKVLGGLSGCRAMFEPTCYFRVYRNIALVGGYTRYDKTYDNAEDAYWQYIYTVEDMTKEIIPYSARINILEKTRQMYENINSDNRFKVFLLVDGEINSVWERGDGA